MIRICVMSNIAQIEVCLPGALSALLITPTTKALSRRLQREPWNPTKVRVYHPRNVSNSIHHNLSEQIQLPRQWTHKHQQL